MPLSYRQFHIIRHANQYLAFASGMGTISEQTATRLHLNEQGICSYLTCFAIFECLSLWGKQKQHQLVTGSPLSIDLERICALSPHQLQLLAAIDNNSIKAIINRDLNFFAKIHANNPPSEHNRLLQELWYTSPQALEELWRTYKSLFRLFTEISDKDLYKKPGKQIDEYLNSRTDFLNRAKEKWSGKFYLEDIGLLRVNKNDIAATLAAMPAGRSCEIGADQHSIFVGRNLQDEFIVWNSSKEIGVESHTDCEGATKLLLKYFHKDHPMACISYCSIDIDEQPKSWLTPITKDLLSNLQHKQVATTTDSMGFDLLSFAIWFRDLPALQQILSTHSIDPLRRIENSVIESLNGDNALSLAARYSYETGIIALLEAKTAEGNPIFATLEPREVDFLAKYVARNPTSQVSNCIPTNIKDNFDLAVNIIREQDAKEDSLSTTEPPILYSTIQSIKNITEHFKRMKVTTRLHDHIKSLDFFEIDELASDYYQFVAQAHQTNALLRTPLHEALYQLEIATIKNKQQDQQKLCELIEKLLNTPNARLSLAKIDQDGFTPLALFAKPQLQQFIPRVNAILLKTLQADPLTTSEKGLPTTTVGVGNYLKVLVQSEQFASDLPRLLMQIPFNLDDLVAALAVAPKIPIDTPAHDLPNFAAIILFENLIKRINQYIASNNSQDLIEIPSDPQYKIAIVNQDFGQWLVKRHQFECLDFIAAANRSTQYRWLLGPGIEHSRYIVPEILKQDVDISRSEFEALFTTIETDQNNEKMNALYSQEGDSDLWRNKQAILTYLKQQEMGGPNTLNFAEREKRALLRSDSFRELYNQVQLKPVEEVARTSPINVTGARRST